jgi:DNA-binding beta-propeller fold protein YncE
MMVFTVHIIHNVPSIKATACIVSATTSNSGTDCNQINDKKHPPTIDLLATIDRVQSSECYLELSKLSVKDMNDILEALEASGFCTIRWVKLGLKLGLSYNTLKEIEFKFNDPSRSLMECLFKWLSMTGNASWESLTDSLKRLNENAAHKNLLEITNCLKVLQKHSVILSEMEYTDEFICRLQKMGILTTNITDGHSILKELYSAVCRHRNSLKIFACLLKEFRPNSTLADDVINDYECSTVGLNSPFGIAVSDDGHIVLTESTGNCVTVLDKERKKTKTLFKNKLRHPRGVAITPDNFIIIADEHKILKISMDGHEITSVGKYGNKPLEFKSPHGIAISQVTGQIYVVDRGNDRIQILNPDLTLSAIFGSKGSMEGQFNLPSFITVHDGDVYVSDCDNHRVQKFTASGDFIAQFGSCGSGSRQFLHPQAIAVKDDELYVSDWGNHRVCVYSMNHQYVRSIGGYGDHDEQLNGPNGIAFDNNGSLYICDCKNNRIVCIDS